MTGTDSGRAVEQPLWRALTGYRFLTMAYAIALYAMARDDYAHPAPATGYLVVLTVWTLATASRTLSAARCTWPFLTVDLLVALSGILLTRWVETVARIEDGVNTLPSIWTAGAVLGFAIKGGWRWGAAASAVVGAANLVERGAPSHDTVHNVLLVCVASIGIGYVVEVARVSERALARALQIEAATRERERLARDIHDGVLQVLAMVQRRGAALGGEAAELGRMAGEQEVALRSLVAGSVRVPEQAVVAAAAATPGGAPQNAAAEDLTVTLGALAGAQVTFSGPCAPVWLPAEAAGELAAAVGAALENVRRHAGAAARAWILLEDEPDAVLVTVRDDGPGIAEGRLARAEAEGRLGVALSIRGRLRDLGGTARWESVPGQGTEVELRVPKAVGSGGAS
jgi:signal transduction histidine kinase